MSGGITPPDSKGRRHVYTPHFANSAGSVAGPNYGPFMRLIRGGEQKGHVSEAELISIFRHRGPAPEPLYRRYDVTLADEATLESRTYSVTVPSPGNPEEAAADEAREMWADEFGSYGDVSVDTVEET